MKKMNFYFNFGRCCNLLLPVLMFLTGTFAFAGNGTTPSNNAPTAKVSKKAMVGGNLTVTFADRQGGNYGNGTVASMCNMKTGSFSWRITGVTIPGAITINTPFFVRVEAFNALTGQSVGSVVSRQYLNSSDFGAANSASNFNGTMSGLASGFYTARVTLEYTLGEVFEFVDYANDIPVNNFTRGNFNALTGTVNATGFNNRFGSLIIPSANDTEAPVVSGPANVTVNTCAVPYSTNSSVGTFAAYGVTVSDCFVARYQIIRPAGVTDPTPTSVCQNVIFRAIDFDGRQTDRTVCVKLLDVTDPRFDNCWNTANRGNYQIGTVITCGGTVPFTVPTGADALGAADNCGVASLTYTVNGQTAIPVSGVLPAVVPAPAVTNLGPGIYTVVATVTDPSGRRNTCTFTAEVKAPLLPEAPLVCVGQLNIGLNNDCANRLNATYFMQPAAPGLCPPTAVFISIRRNGVWTPFATHATFIAEDITRTLEYRLATTSDGTPTGASVQSCWGNVTVEDKSAPTITKPADITLQCNDLNASALLPISTVTPPVGSISTGTGTPFVNDCSAITTSYSDAVSAITCVASGARTVTRTWIAKDAFGNVSASTQQVITIQRGLTPLNSDVLTLNVPAINIPVNQFVVNNCTPSPAVGGSYFIGMVGNTAFADADAAKPNNSGPIAISCETATADLAAAVIGNGPFVYLGTTKFFLQSNGICGLTATYVDTRTDICAGSYKVVRTWTIMDMCSTLFGSGVMSCQFNQHFLVTPKAPTATATYIDYALTRTTLATCKGNQTIATVTATPVTAFTLPADADRTGCNGGNPAAFYSRAITPRAVSDMCDAARVNMTISPVLSCGGALAAFSPVSVSTSDLTVTANANGTYTIAGLLMNANMADVAVGVRNGAGNCGDTKVYGGSFVISVADNCGTVNKYTILVDFQDNISPVAVCDGVTATLNTDKKAIIRAASFNNNSTDNCGIDKIFIRRMESTTWCDTVKYECTTPATMVVIRYIDFSGNFTDCMVPISIIDKSPIACANPANIDVLCNDVRLNNLTGLFTTPSFSYDGCGAVTTTNPADVTVPINCGNGSITRTWVFSTSNANGAASTSCAQTITIKPVRGFRATPIARRDLVCSGDVPTLAADKATVIASLQLLHDGTYSAGAPNANIAAYTTCSAPVVEAAEWTYSNTEYCKVIVRTFTIKDVCDFSTNVDDNAYGNVRGTQLQSQTLSTTTTVNAGSEIIRFTTYTYIKDNTAPTSTQITVAPICVINTTCNFGFTQALNGTDGCTGGTSTGASTGSSMNYTWRIVDAAGVAVGAPGTGATVSATGLAFGTYTVFYRVADLCGNLSTEYSFTVTGNDCKAPQVLVHNKIVALAGQTGNRESGMATLLYADIRNNISDNCLGDLTNATNKIVMELVLATDPANPLAPRNVAPNQTIMLNCSHVGTTRVRVWANDGAGATIGNWNFATSELTVQDNDGICTARPIIAGTIGTEAGAPVKDVVVSANANGIVAASASSAAAGTYIVTGLTPGTNYQVRAAKTIDTDKKNGVTTLDIALISKHLLAETELNSAYKIIAADVDKNGEVDATDMLHIRRFILSITSNLPAGSAWRFVDKAYAFRNSANPLGEDFPEVVSLANVPVGTNPANFTAVKLGDVNNSFDAATVRGSRVLAFNAEDMAITAGNEYTVAITSENMTAAAFQGTFSFDGAKVKAVKAGSLNNVTDNNFNMTANAVAASWNGKSEAGATVANITFLATKSGKLSEMLTVNSALTMAEGYDAAGNAMNVTLKFNNGKVAGGEFALYQNTPNPVASSTKIGFNLPKDGQAKLTIYTAEGKVLSVTNNNYKAGYNEVTINKSDLNASGMLYYRLDTQDNSSTRKMIVIE